MILNTHAREWYTLNLTTDPPVAAWEASFDTGATWTSGEPAAGRWRWLVAGVHAPADGTPAATIARTMAPLVRAVEHPEVIVRRAPQIIVE